MPKLWDLIRNENCTSCPLHENAQAVCLIGDGRYPADLLFVGEAPGFREDNVRKPFAGRAGELLDVTLETLSIPRWGKETRIFISNAVHCRPPDNQKPSNQEIDVCSKLYLSKEVKHVKPKLIVALGQVAAQALLQRKVTVTGARNKIWYTEPPFGDKIPLIVTFHPAAALRRDYLIEKITEDLNWAKEVLKNGIKEEVLDYRRIRTVADAPSLRDCKWISLDLETDGFDPFLPSRNIISVQLSGEKGKAYYLRWNKEVCAEVKRICEDPAIGKVGHNLAKFDRKWLRKAGITLRGPIHDTLLSIHLLDENYPEKDLDAVASAFTSLKHHKKSLKDWMKEHKGAEFRDVPDEIAIPYGCGDADACIRLRKVFVPRLKEQGLMPLFRMQMQATKLYSDLEWDGCKIQVSLLDELADLYEKKIDINQKHLNETCGEEVNPASSQQVGKILYDKWKLPAVGRPKSWKDPPVKNTAEETLLKLMEMELEPKQKRFIKKTLRLRELRKLLSTYILGIGDFIRPGDFIHPNYKLHGTVTGRSSCVDPNLQQVPRDGDIKRLFISRYGSSGTLMQIDVSQGELRIAAHRSQEKTLLAYFRQGNIDIHRKVAARVLGKPEDRVTEKERKKAKIVNFGILYGASEFKMGAQMNRPAKEAKKFIDRWMEEFSMWRPFVASEKRKALKYGYVVSDFGRRRRLPIIDPTSKQGQESLRQAVNSPIQGGLHDYTVLCGLQAREEIKERKIPKVHFIAEVHDSWLIDTVQENISILEEIFKKHFQNPDTSAFGFKLSVPMDIEIKVGPNWKNLKTIYPEKGD